MQNDTEKNPENGRTIVTVRTVEIAVAIVIMAFAALLIVSNYILGASWDSYGPQSGYFPFYVGIILFIAAAAIFAQQLTRREPAREIFIEHRPFVRVVQVLLPTVIYVALIGYIGIYVASTILIATFMVWLGRYRVVTAIVTAALVSLALFMTFEVWFLVPLPKGPLERWFGY